MKSNFSRLVGLAFAISATTSSAGTEDATVPLRGFALTSCGAILEIGENDVQRIQLSEWLNGYISSYNYYNKPKVTPPESASSRAFAQTYCQHNPLHNAWNMAAALVEALGGKKALHKYKP